MPVRRVLCDPVDPTDLNWVPHYNLDHPSIHPDLSLLLTWYLPSFIDTCTRNALSEVKPLLGQATKELLQVFDFNRNLKYDCAAFAHELRVRAHCFEV
jgi:hypothetical protein